MRTKLHCGFIGLAFLAGVHSVLAQVTNLGIAPAGNQTVLFWSASATNYILQSTTNLNSPNWSTVTDAVPVTAVAVTNTLPARFFRLFNTNPPAGMAFIPAGVFVIGDVLDGEFDAIPTNVKVSAFFMDTNLVTYTQWQSVYSFATNLGYGFANAGAGKVAPPIQPVQTVDWYDAVKWCNARSQQEGLTPAYYTDGGLAQVYTNGETTNVFVNWTVNGYRLPTEAEWEKAARGGVSGLRFPWFPPTISEGQANYTGNVGGFDLGPNGPNTVIGTSGGFPFTSPVGFFAANSYGLYDMAGNVSEWCWDWYAPPAYPAGSPYLGGSDPRGPTTGTRRVLRGGSWSDPAGYLRCAFRDNSDPVGAGNGLGFRCARGQ
jgi:formylglycine-generating enzyme required for sulfatase activity